MGYDFSKNTNWFSRVIFSFNKRSNSLEKCSIFFVFSIAIALNLLYASNGIFTVDSS